MPGEGDINDRENTKIPTKGASICMCILQNSTGARKTRDRGTTTDNYSL